MVKLSIFMVYCRLLLYQTFIKEIGKAGEELCNRARQEKNINVRNGLSEPKGEKIDF